MDKYIAPHKEWVEETIKKIDKKLKVVAPRTKGIPPYTSVDGKHTPVYSKDREGNTIVDYSWWTNGFWGGLMWLMYLETKDEMYKACAIDQEDLLDKGYEYIGKIHHDVGFMWHLTSAANYRITGERKSRVRSLVAAAMLSSRYNLKGGFIRAWNGDNSKTWTIIDTMMNLPLLYWASNETGDDRFTQIAEAHIDMVMQNHIRPDGSVAHIICHDIDTGDYKEIDGQGYGPGSSWSRGQGWALYGFILAYIHTGKQEYLDTAKKVAHYFISCVCDDYLPKVDFRSPDEPVIIDSTASGLAACGLIEIAKHVPELEKKIYINAAIKLLKALDENCVNYDESEDALVLRGSHSYHREKEREMPIVYGDFYYVEALLKLKNSDFLIW